MTAAYQSETGKHRDLVAEYCAGSGLDIGFGGDPVSASAIRMDLPTPYAQTGDAPVQLGGDCRDLYWFQDGTLDYVYSSHVLEDFPRDETRRVLAEWARVVRVGGRLVLLLPDQQRYLHYVQRIGSGPNLHHSIDDFSLRYVCDVATRVGGLDVEATHEEVGEYSFLAVFRKTGAAVEQEGDVRLRLQTAWRERDDAVLELHRLQHELRHSRLFRGARALSRIVAKLRSLRA
jgi:predicted SAM-dependent methyltransferase